METFHSRDLRFVNYVLRFAVYDFRFANYNTRFSLCIVLTAVLLLTGSNGARAAEPETAVNSSITNVTVFINQAQVTRVAKANLEPGTTTLVFDKVSPFINLNTIQVRVEDKVVLMSVTHRTNFLKENQKPAQVVDLEDSLRSVTWSLESVHNRKQTYQFEKDVMMANKHIGGQQTGVKPDDLEDALVLFRKRTMEINDEIMKLNHQEKRLVEIKTKLENQLNELRNGMNLDAPEILVTVKTLAAVNHSRIELSYMVSNASWQPFYDIRVKDTKSPLQLVSKAFISQATREDWKNVILKLSTSNPNEGGTKPELQTNFISFYQNAAPAPAYQSLSEVQVRKKYKPDSKNEDGMLMTTAGIAPPAQTPVSIEFNVSSAYSIPSDNSPHQVDLTSSNLDAVYAYGAVPRLDKDAFVTAKVSGNDLVNQISGEANVYFDGTFVGKTYINGTTNDSLTLSLGRDKRIQIQRIMLKDFCSKTFTGSYKKELSTWEIKVRNTRKEPVVIVVEDQVPVSTDKEIEVKLIQAEQAKYDETTGKLTWTLRLDAEQTQSVKFSFEVKFPKEKQVTGY